VSESSSVDRVDTPASERSQLLWACYRYWKFFTREEIVDVYYNQGGKDCTVPTDPKNCCCHRVVKETKEESGC